MVAVLAILAGALIWSGFAPIENPLGPILGNVLLFRILLDRELMARFILVLIAALAFFLPLLHWSSSYVGAVPWLILSIGQSLLFSTIALLPLMRNLISLFVFAGAVTAMEILRMKVPFGGFGWGRVGHTQVDIFAQFYPIFGVAGITFLVSFIGASVVVYPFKTLVILLIGLLSGPILPTFISAKKVPVKEIEVIAVQGGVDKLGLEFNDRALSVLQRHATLTDKDLASADLILWPENAADVDPLRNLKARQIVQDAVERAGTNLLIGAVLQSGSGPKNAAILLTGDGDVQSTYVKQDLAPFGEYIPLRALSEFVAPEAREVRDFQPGKDWVWHRVSDTNFVSLICFEILDDDFVRSGMQKAEFAVAQTNNATFGRSPQAAQQLQITRARATELGRDFAVVSTTGFTGHINREGELISMLEQFEPGTLAMKIDTYESKTLASHISSWFWILVFGATLAVRSRSIFTR